MAAFMRQVMVSVLLFALVFGQAPRFQLLEPGVFHGQDVQLSQPAAWVGIYCQDNACRTRPATVRSTRVADPLGDDDPKTPTGTSIEVLTPDQPLFLVRGISASQRPIPTFFVGERSMVGSDQFDIQLLKAEYALRVDGNKTAEEQLPKGSRLMLSSGSLTQELFSLPAGGNDPYITVLWIGDLDGDGKLDLYLNSSSHYNVSHKVLWLSSLAKAGQLVGQAAVFETMGC